MKKRIFEIISWLALAGTILPSFLYFGGGMTLDQVKDWMLLSAIAWFVATPFWMRHHVSD